MSDGPLIEGAIRSALAVADLTYSQLKKRVEELLRINNNSVLDSHDQVHPTKFTHHLELLEAEGKIGTVPIPGGKHKHAYHLVIHAGLSGSPAGSPTKLGEISFLNSAKFDSKALVLLSLIQPEGNSIKSLRSRLGLNSAEISSLIGKFSDYVARDDEKLKLTKLGEKVVNYFNLNLQQFRSNNAGFFRDVDINQIPFIFQKPTVWILPRCTVFHGFQEILDEGTRMVQRAQLSMWGATSQFFRGIANAIIEKKGIARISDIRMRMIANDESDEYVKVLAKAGIETRIATERDTFIATVIVDGSEVGFLLPCAEWRAPVERHSWELGFWTNEPLVVSLFKDMYQYMWDKKARPFNIRRSIRC
jgi:hypothetical protein